MFTGIIRDLGTLERVDPSLQSSFFIFKTGYDLTHAFVGESIACNGTCLTILEKSQNQFRAEVSNETLRVTTLGNWKAGDKINFEMPLKMGDTLGGHLLTGHVDGIAVVTSIVVDGDCWLVDFCVPASHGAFLATKGSIAIDGVSLTVNGVEDTADGTIVKVNILPHTWNNTTFHTYGVGSKVNFEVDLMARYAQRLLSNRS